MSIPDFSNPTYFDALVALARKNPVAFEDYRKRLIERVIDEAPAERRVHLRRFQWRIEQETRNVSCAMGRCIKLSSLMVERLDRLSEQIQLLNSAAGSHGPVVSHARKATVLPMKFSKLL